VSDLQTIKVPDMGDFDDVEVIEVLIAVGDTIDVETSLITVESDKASMEIPSPAAGVVTSVVVSVGDRVSKQQRKQPRLQYMWTQTNMSILLYSVLDLVVTPQRFAPQTLARKYCWWNATRTSVASA